MIDPARASKPKDKPRVERQMPYVRDSLWRGRTWGGETDMAAAALRWCTEVAGVRSHRALGGSSPLQVFSAVEAPALLPLPPDPFELATWSRPKVGPDCHVKVGKVLYSVPWRYIGHQVDARLGSGGFPGPTFRRGAVRSVEAGPPCAHGGRPHRPPPGGQARSSPAARIGAGRDPRR